MKDGIRRDPFAESTENYGSKESKRIYNWRKEHERYYCKHDYKKYRENKPETFFILFVSFHTIILYHLLQLLETANCQPA